MCAGHVQPVDGKWDAVITESRGVFSMRRWWYVYVYDFPYTMANACQCWDGAEPTHPRVVSGASLGAEAYCGKGSKAFLYHDAKHMECHCHNDAGGASHDDNELGPLCPDGEPFMDWKVEFRQFNGGQLSADLLSQTFLSNIVGIYLLAALVWLSCSSGCTGFSSQASGPPTPISISCSSTAAPCSCRAPRCSA